MFSNREKVMKYVHRITIIITAFLLSSVIASASIVERSFNDTIEINGNVTIHINVNITKNETYYAIDDIYPPVFTLISTDSYALFNETGHVKWLVLMDAVNTTYYYVLSAPAVNGTYSFAGEYMFEGDVFTSTIAGQSEITVENEITQNPPDNITSEHPPTERQPIIRLVIAIGFGLIGLFALLTIVLYSGKDSTAIVKIMIALIIIFTIISTVLQGL